MQGRLYTHALFAVILILSHIDINVFARTTSFNDSAASDNNLHAFLKKLTGQNQPKINSSIQGCFFGGYDFSFLNQNNGSDYIGTDVGTITNTYKMNICGAVNDNACQYSWRIPTSVCYICTRGNPHALGSVTLIGSFGSDGAGVAWNFIDPRKPELGVTMTYINGENPCSCSISDHCLPATIVALQCSDKTENNMRVFVNTTSCVTYLYLNIKCLY
jgi:hypothetical protein